MKPIDGGGRGIPPSIPPLATVGFQCYACGWRQRHAVTAADLSANRRVSLWVRCKFCNGFAFLTGVEAESTVPKSILEMTSREGDAAVIFGTSVDGSVPRGIFGEGGFYGPIRPLHEHEAEMWSTLGIRWEDA